MRRTERLALVLAFGALAGCSLAPPLELPKLPVAEAYREVAPWIEARPADALPRDAWWSLYGDADLDALETKLIANSPDLAAALARYHEARAIAAAARSGLFPIVTGSVDAERDRQSEKKPLRVPGPQSPNEYGAYTVGAELGYELDLWGRVRNEVTAGDADAAAAAADLESARQSLEATLAGDYVELRRLDRETKLLEDTVDAYAKALDLTRSRHAGGIASGLDVARAETQIETAKSALEQVRAVRATTEHAIAALVGASPSTFAIAPKQVVLHVVEVPPGVPATLLERRPDIAAAERRVEAANARVGVARSAFFPAITLDATAGFQSSDAGHWIEAPNTFWSIGPSIVLTLFDAGKRKADVARAEAALDENGARYRAVVLGAFREVEDNLALLAKYRAASEADAAAVAAAERSLEFSMSRYRGGAVSYLDVVTAQTTALAVRRESLDLESRRLQASVALIRALGGGWSAAGRGMASGQGTESKPSEKIVSSAGGA